MIDYTIKIYDFFVFNIFTNILNFHKNITSKTGDISDL